MSSNQGFCCTCFHLEGSAGPPCRKNEWELTHSLYLDRKFAKMGRMHSKGKGISSSALPYRRTPPSWLKTTPEEVCNQIFKLARKGLTPSQIGVQLRDSQGIAQVRFVTGNKILRILKSEGLAPQIPEDLYHLIVSHAANTVLF